MNTQLRIDNAIAAIRISSVKQGLQGDSPEAQKEQIERFAQLHNIHIKKFFIFMESASKEEQPVQEAIDYCKNPKNDIQLFIIKSIDRFTRGGSYLYDHLKMQLVKYKVQLVDIYGIIGSQEVNTLEHLGLEYNWSVYSPTKKSEILEAERAKDEMRDIMTRMIGAEIRYVRLGFRVRQAPFGYVNEKVETAHGKRVILMPHPVESEWIIRMFELRMRGTLNDAQIVEEINALGFKTRKRYLHSRQNKTKVVGKLGECPLSIKQFWLYIANPIYAGINTEKWTQGQAIKGKFEGLVSIETFNKANKGKVTISEEGDEIRIWKKAAPDWLVHKVVKNPDFPYRRYVLCPHCEQPLYGSASRGKMGKYYPGYHCNKRGHYFRVPTKEFDGTIRTFLQGLKIDEEYVEKLEKLVMSLWEKHQEESTKDTTDIEKQISEQKALATVTAEKIRFLNSEIAIKYVEEDLVKIEKEIQNLEQSKQERKRKDADMQLIMTNISYFLEHLENLVMDSPFPEKRGEYFHLIFEKVPTYEELVSGTPKLVPFIDLKQGDNHELLLKSAPTKNRTWI